MDNKYNLPILSVYDSEFKKYGNVLEGFDFAELFDVCESISPKPTDMFTYSASVPELEALSVTTELQNHIFGGMPIQVGYCNGSNYTLNCLEYHRSSELNIALNSVILLLGCVSEMEDFKFDTAKVKAFEVPSGVGVELYGTTLHYAPCSAESDGYRVICVLPRGTNGDRPEMENSSKEDELCTGTNKWIIAHKDAPEAQNGVYVGLYGENITLK